MIIYIAVFVAAAASQVSAQAPGDHADSCRTGFNEPSHDFPTEWRVLVDTYDYTDLYGFVNPVWTVHDEDGDGNRGYMQNVGGSCTWTIRTCTEQPTQDNWLVSQFISYEDANEVFFNVTYRFTECLSRPSCTRPYLTPFSYNRDSIASEVEKTDFENNYQPLIFDTSNVGSSLLEQPAGSNSAIGVTLSFTRPATSGFYLGLRDEGTCGNVERIIVYYIVCPARQEGLVLYPETAVPVRTSSDILFNANCVLNAHNITTLAVTASSATSSCSPVASGGPMCECDAGHVLSADEMSCEACPAGTFSPLGSTTCNPCPGNTMTDVVGASECSCVQGFYRSISQQEGPEVGCTEPPSGCTDLQVTTRGTTSLTLTWSRPATDGRSDLFYRVMHSDPDSIGDFIVENDNLVNDAGTVTYEVTNLDPFTSYIVRVTTHNGVSDQDPDNAHLRQCEVSSMTVEAAPGPLGNVQRLCTTIVWQAPDQPNGVLTGYELSFSNLEQSITVGPDRNFYITGEAQRGQTVKVKLRAINGAGVGVYTPPNLVCPAPCVLDPETTSRTNTSITISWRSANFSGSVSYRIELSDPNDETSFREVGNITSGALMYTITGLDPFTTYRVRLMASNGVDTNQCQIDSMTAEGVSSAPAGLRRFCGVVVWQPPAQPNGIITGYDVLISGQVEGTVGPEVNYYELDSQQEVAIRATNGAGRGQEETISADCSGDSAAEDALFSEVNGVELAIVIVCTFAVTLTIVTLIFLAVCCCMHKRRSGSSSKKVSVGNDYGQELKHW